MLGRTKHIAIIGSGVIGLTVAYRLLEAGYMVTVLGRVLPPQTTSDVAAAYWSPTVLSGDARSQQWGYDSLAMFHHLVTKPAAGITHLGFYKLSDEPMRTPTWENVGPIRAVSAASFPGNWHGYHMTIPRIDVPIYMPWLLAQVEAKGGLVHQRIVQRIGEVGTEFAAIINCSGLGARLLTNDDVYPIRGQVMRVRPPAGLPHDIISAETNTATTYLIPRSQDWLLGGTYQYHNGNLEVDAEIAAGILERCAQFYPILKDAEILQHRVGLRPGRAEVRLESERLRSGQIIIHNYGHGSVGHTLSWGCASEVVKLLQETVG
ncbi:MAG: FAD-dependent oxidoreductase [Caldilineaceae bacterium]